MMSFPGVAGFMIFMSFMVELFLVCGKGSRFDIGHLVFLAPARPGDALVATLESLETVLLTSKRGQGKNGILS